MINLNWTQSFFHRLKLFGTLERPERKQWPFGGPKNTKLNQANCEKNFTFLTTHCHLFLKMSSFWPCFSIPCTRGHMFRDCHKRKVKEAKNKQTMNRNRRLTFKYSLFNWWARSSNISNRSVLAQLSAWLTIWLFSWFSLFLAVHWEIPPHLSNKTSQSQKIYAR